MDKEAVQRIREHWEDLRAQLDALELSEFMHYLRGTDASAAPSADDSERVLGDFMEGLWRTRSAAYQVEQAAPTLLHIPVKPNRAGFQPAGSVEWVDPNARDHAGIRARLSPDHEVVAFFLFTDQDGDLDLAMDLAALDRVIDFLRGVRADAGRENSKIW